MFSISSSTTGWLIMEHVHIVLHNSISGLQIKRVSLRLSVPTCEPESPASSNNWHFPHGGKHRIPPQQAQRAAVVFPFREDEVHYHQQARFVLGRRSVNALGLSHEFGSRLRAHRQWVVDHGYESEKRGGGVGGWGLRHSDGGGVWTADNVVEEEMKVAELLLFQSQRLPR